VFEYKFETVAVWCAIAAAIFPFIANGTDRLSDPTRPPDSLNSTTQNLVAPADEKLELRAIFFAEGRRLAVINNHRLQEADQIGQAQVIEIFANHVHMRREGKDFDLYLIQQEVKKQTRSNSNKREASSRSRGMVAETRPVEAWGGPSTAPLASDTSQTGGFDSLNDNQPASIANDWDKQAGSQRDDAAGSSGNRTPGMLDALLGEGKEK